VLTGCLSAAPQRFVTVQTAFATAPASKNRSMPIVSPAPKPRPTSAMAARQKLYLRQRQRPEVESPPGPPVIPTRHNRSTPNSRRFVRPAQTAPNLLRRKLISPGNNGSFGLSTAYSGEVRPTFAVARSEFTESCCVARCRPRRTSRRRPCSQSSGK